MDVNTLKAEINSAVDTAASVAEVVAPQYVGFIVLGQAVAHALPDLYADVQSLISKKEPADADVAALAQKISALSNPETI